MSTALGLAQFWLLAALGFAALVSLLTPIAQRLVRERLIRLPPALRHRIYLLWSMAPLGLGLAVASLLLVPSALAGLGWVEDHCHAHDHVHLCLLHPPTPSGDALGLTVLGVFGSLVLLHAAGLLGTVRRARRIRRLLQSGVAGEDRNGVVQTRHPNLVALTIGFWRPRVYVSHALLKSLSPAQRTVLLAHEHAHAHRRDGLWGLLAQTLSLLHLPHIRRRILSELHLAAEEACDAEAASQCGDGLRVAETILAVARRMQAGTTAEPLAMPALTGSSVEQRVHALLAPAGPVHISRRKLGTLALLLLIALAAGLEPLHHTVESLLTHWFV